LRCVTQSNYSMHFLHDNVLAFTEPKPGLAQSINTKATTGNGEMKIITKWHCTEILQGKERERTPRGWLILVGPGEDVIVEVETVRRPTKDPELLATRH
jgi:hypothetical protein